MKLLELYQSQMDLANEKEETKVRKARNATIECKAEQLAHAARQQKDKVENRILLIEKERALRNQYDGDDVKFKQICMDDIAKFEAEGKPTYPLYRAMEYKQPEILPVSGFRV